MSAKRSQSFWVGILVLNLLSSVVLADPAASVTPDNPEKLAAQAKDALDHSELDVAVKLYLKAAEQNYIPAQVAMGEFADTSQFYEEAVGWFLMAAMQGDAAGQYHLGRMYLLGNGIEKDDSKASYWFRRSAAKNYLPSVQFLANAYRLGILGLKVDLDQAKSWDAKASRLQAIEQRALNKKLEKLTESTKKLQEEAEKKANK